MALTVLITSPTLGVRRCGYDEPDAAWVPEGIWFESVLPGGWKGGGFNLRQRIDQDLGLRLLDEVEFVDEHGQTVYEGRITKLPRQHGDDYLLGVECLGWASHMLDDTSFAVIYRDMELSRWVEPSASYRLGLLSGVTPYVVGSSGVDADATTGSPGLRLEVRGPWANRTAAVAAYDAGSALRIGSIYYGWRKSDTVNAGSASWSWLVRGADDDLMTVGVESSANLRAVGPGAGTLTFTNPKRFGQVVLAFSAAGASVADTFTVSWTTVAVMGDHGLTLAGTEPAAGFYIDDMLVHALQQACPKLSVASVEDGGLVERPPLVVSQAAYPDPGPVDRVVLDLNKYVLYEWGVYHGRRFFYRPTDPDRLCWNARLDRGIHLGLEGDDAEHAHNGWMVKYTDASGLAKVAGPTGSGFDVESDLLLDVDPENTVNQHGYPRKWGETTVSFPLGSDDYAVTIGAAYLAQTALPSRAGTVEVVGDVEHPTKGLRPVREVLAGDWVRLSDHPADVPRRIIATRYDEDSLKVSVTVGNDMDTVGAILEQVEVKT